MIYINIEGGVNNMTIKEILSKGMIMLKGSNIDSPKLKARLLLQYIIKKPLNGAYFTFD